jgi:hypothetical protein
VLQKWAAKSGDFGYASARSQTDRGGFDNNVGDGVFSLGLATHFPATNLSIRQIGVAPNQRPVSAPATGAGCISRKNQQ